MGLKITKSIKNANGSTSAEHYINVGDFIQIRKKIDYLMFVPQIWVSKAGKDAGEKQVSLPGVNIEFILCTVSDLDSGTFYAVCYSKLKTKLKELLSLADNEIVDL